MVLGEIDSAISLWERVQKLRKKPEVKQQVSIATRFFELFEAHGVHRNQIPKFLADARDKTLSLADVSDEQRLLESLDDELLDTVCELFGVRRAWLDGASDQIYDLHHFYKHTGEFSDYIDLLKGRSDNVGGMIYVCKPKKRWLMPERRSESMALLALEERIGQVVEGEQCKTIYRFHLCPGWVYNYWKCRAYLTSCIAVAWNKSVYIDGYYVPPEDIENRSEGNQFMALSDIEGLSRMGGIKFDPEDMALCPKKYLEGVDEGDFGKQAALSKWVDLASEGWMGSGFGKPPVEVFEKELSDIH